MYRAKKNLIVMNMFQLVQRRMLKGMFGKLYIKNDYQESEPALYIGNHSAWWDGLLLFELERQQIIPDLYVMTDVEGMKRVPIFKWIGAYSIDATSPKHIMESMRYSEHLLRQRHNVWIFPQGMERHLEERSLQFQQGAAVLMNRITVPVVPVTIYYTFRNSKKAEAWVWIGAPIYYGPRQNRSELTCQFEQVVTLQLDTLKQQVIANDHAQFNNIL